MSLGGALPSVGPPPVTGWGRSTRRRKDQIQIWSAVALQQHFSRGAMVQSSLPTLEEVPAPLPGGRLTLAQKMGLVPLPPPAPSDDEWAKIEGTALRRTRTLPIGADACCICQEPFYATMEQGQVLLSCSHVFHEHCFRHFEKFVRRSRGRYDATPLCCPMCRCAHYHKRVFYAGKAMTQRAAIVKIQSIFRRALARKAYVQQRLLSDPGFCASYAQVKLARLSNVYAMYAERQERERRELLDSVDLRRQRALALCTTPREWALLRMRLQQLAAEASLECPICLCAIAPNPNGDAALLELAKGEAIVAAFRREYEARVAEEKQTREKGKRHSNAPIQARRQQVRASQQVSEDSKQRHPSLPKRNLQMGNKRQVQPSPSVSQASSGSKEANGSRYGVMLSCGHCLHDVCLTAFEKYSEMVAVQRNGETVIPRCPLCRSAYIKADF